MYLSSNTQVLSSPFVNKHTLLSRLFKEDKITFDELLILLDKTPEPCHCPPPYCPPYRYPLWTTGDSPYVVNMNAGSNAYTSNSTHLLGRA